MGRDRQEIDRDRQEIDRDRQGRGGCCGFSGEHFFAIYFKHFYFIAVNDLTL